VPSSKRLATVRAGRLSGSGGLQVEPKRGRRARDRSTLADLRSPLPVPLARSGPPMALPIQRVPLDVREAAESTPIKAAYLARQQNNATDRPGSAAAAAPHPYAATDSTPSPPLPAKAREKLSRPWAPSASAQAARISRVRPADVNCRCCSGSSCLATQGPGY